MSTLSVLPPQASDGHEPGEFGVAERGHLGAALGNERREFTAIGCVGDARLRRQVKAGAERELGRGVEQGLSARCVRDATDPAGRGASWVAAGLNGANSPASWLASTGHERFPSVAENSGRVPRNRAKSPGDGSRRLLLQGPTFAGLLQPCEGKVS